MTHEPKLVVTGRVLTFGAAARKLNPHLFAQAGGPPPGGLAGPERKSDPLPSLGKRPKVQRGGKSRVVVCVTIIACRNREIDSDNLSSGAKCLRDCIATSLGIDDADKRIRWEYGFAQTSGPEQTIVRIAVK